VSISVAGYDQQLKTYVIDNCLAIAYENYAAGVSVPGDSGSAVVGNFGGTNKVVGLLFAAGSATSLSDQPNYFGVVCRITEIARVMSVAPANTISPVVADPNSWLYQISPDDPAAKMDSVTIGGKKYWQIGNAYCPDC